MKPRFSRLWGSYTRDDIANLRRARPLPERHADLEVWIKEVVEAFTENSLIIEQVLRGLSATFECIDDRMTFIQLESTTFREKEDGEPYSVQPERVEYLKGRVAAKWGQG